MAGQFSWQMTFGPGLKAAVITQINAATVANSVQDLGAAGEPINLLDATLASHFAAAKSAVQAAVAALVGSAPKLKVIVTGYTDTGAAVPGVLTTASWMNIRASEFWN
jgi:hypothetical protein